eukprot:6131576-Pleurochrysis_carterae.AAC.2
MHDDSQPGEPPPPLHQSRTRSRAHLDPRPRRRRRRSGVTADWRRAGCIASRLRKARQITAEIGISAPRRSRSSRAHFSLTCRRHVDEVRIRS